MSGVFSLILIFCVLGLLQAMSFYEMEATDIHGNLVSMEKYRDAKAIIVGMCTKFKYN